LINRIKGKGIINIRGDYSSYYVKRITFEVTLSMKKGQGKIYSMFAPREGLGQIADSS